MFRAVIVSFALLIQSLPAYGQTLVFANTCPPKSKSDPDYLAGLANLRSAVQSGKRIHVAMELPESGTISHFYVELTAAKVSADYASGILSLRPPINNAAQAVASNGLVAGSLDSLGNYVYGEYRFGSDTMGPSRAITNNTGTYACYVNKWFVN